MLSIKKTCKRATGRRAAGTYYPPAVWLNLWFSQHYIPRPSHTLFPRSDSHTFRFSITLSFNHFSFSIWPSISPFHSFLSLLGMCCPSLWSSQRSSLQLERLLISRRLLNLEQVSSLIWIYLWWWPTCNLRNLWTDAGLRMRYKILLSPMQQKTTGWMDSFIGFF